MHRHFALLADYNLWMNRKLYAAASGLSAAALAQPRGAFFGSILGTLNHLVVADTLWLKRFAGHPAHATGLQSLHSIETPAALDAMPFTDWSPLERHRQWLDALIVSWVQSTPEPAWSQPLAYANTRGQVFNKPMDLLMLHFFNHQTHHRGQTTTLLSQAGIDVGETDLRALIADVQAD